ncbi:uncharacterized protein UMAG_04849 [Mycosarcoma maydis]|uniref:INO80 complex subunit F domain-containing protein n=1 Tax=Mycosarcoma maydis TaxID=5270 RepID=A0A0D1BY13_MYCMD|nr:uncharacterized protein UMAG_04849 [Ustilago maydis 521]KIS66787.1 hypothetical protein UMAG_04849 [Ustilago maydis 521]|eukprot:XP_011391698.1 hypothetical protein UMAG_04849 [Ustilago maydis 521]
MSAPTPATQPVKTKSKAYSSTVAIQGDAAKYRLKYKELKKKVREIEVENDKLHLKTLGIKRSIQRMRLERAILYERLEAESQATPGVAAYPPMPTQHYDIEARHDDSYAAAAGGGGGGGGVSSSSAARVGADEYPAYAGSSGGGDRSSAYRHPQPAPAAATSRTPYSSAYDDYPPPPPRSHPNPAPSAHARPYATSSSYDSRHQSPQPPPLPASSSGERAERLRQYTESTSPEPVSASRRDARGTSPPLTARSPVVVGAAEPPLPPAARSNIKVTLRRGA